MYSNILLPVDLNHDSSWDKALPIAIEHCKAYGAPLHVMTVATSYFFVSTHETKELAELDRDLKTFIQSHIPAELTVHGWVAEGTAYKEILRVAQEVNADLIIMASHHPELKDYLLEPTAERVLRHAEVSVLVVRQ